MDDLKAFLRVELKAYWLVALMVSKKVVVLDEWLVFAMAEMLDETAACLLAK